MISNKEFLYIVQMFCIFFNVDKSLVLSNSRKRKYNDVRHFVAYYLRGMGLSLEDIGILMGKHYSTILNSCNIVENLLTYNQKYIEYYTKAITKLRNNKKLSLQNNIIVTETTKDKIVYIAGKITGLNKDFTHKKFMHVQEVLQPYAKAVINPITATEYLPDGTAWNEYMKALIPMLMTAEALVFTPDSYNSKGARWEINFAREILQIPTIEFDFNEEHKYE